MDDPRDLRIEQPEAENKQTWQVLCSIAETCKQPGQDLIQFICSKMRLAAVEG